VWGCGKILASEKRGLRFGPIGDSTTVLRSDADPTGRKDRVDMNETKYYGSGALWTRRKNMGIQWNLKGGLLAKQC